jgi:hypothetical protein
MHYKPIIAIIAIAAIAYIFWEIGWQIWEQKELWQYMTNIEYQNLLLTGEATQATIILTAAFIIGRTQKQPQPTTITTTQPKQQKENLQLKKLTEQITQLQNEVKKINVITKLNPETTTQEKNRK